MDEDASRGAVASGCARPAAGRAHGECVLDTERVRRYFNSQVQVDRWHPEE
jgi:hypothetical protein